MEALRACGVGSGDRVLLPGLVCREVLAAVHMLRAAPVFYPVSPALTPESDADQFLPAKAVLAVNYFGFPQDLAPFRRYCARTGAALIEDNAHGLMSRDADGALLGGRGDAGIFSLRKTLPVPGGAALVVPADRRGDLPAALTPVSAIPAHFRLKQAFRHFAAVAGPVRTVKAILAIRRMQHRTPNGGATAAGADSETRIPSWANPPALVTRGLNVSSPQLESERRCALYDVVGRLLGAVGAVAVFPHLPARSVPFGFPVRASVSEGSALTTYLASNGFLLAPWPDLPAAIAPAAPEHYRNLWVVPFLW